MLDGGRFDLPCHPAGVCVVLKSGFCFTGNYMTEIANDARFMRDPDLVAADMDGDLVMMSIDNGEYYGVGGVGPRIWELLESPRTVEQISAAIVDEFEVEADTCREDILGFIRQLLDMGLVRQISA